jgi:hypothetical protein
MRYNQRKINVIKVEIRNKNYTLVQHMIYLSIKCDYPLHRSCGRGESPHCHRLRVARARASRTYDKLYFIIQLALAAEFYV